MIAALLPFDDADLESMVLGLSPRFNALIERAERNIATARASRPRMFGESWGSGDAFAVVCEVDRSVRPRRSDRIVDQETDRLRSRSK